MILFPGDDKIGYPDRTTRGVHFPVGGAERYGIIDADLITVRDIDAGTASIKDATIVNAKIANLTIQGGKIAAGTITADKLAVNNLSAITADLGTVTAGSISGVTLSISGVLTIDGNGLTFANSGSPGLFFNSAGGGSPATIFNDGSSNFVVRAGTAEAIYFQQRTGGSTTMILDTSGRIVQVGTSGSDASLLLSPRSAAPTGQKGLIYYDSDDDHFYGHNGTSWVQLDN